mgnify:CR=1 FL=1
MAKYFNFTIQYIPCENTHEMFRMLNENKTDFNIGGIVMTYYRYLRMHFFFTHWIDYITFGTRWPEKNHVTYDLLLKPFSYQIWFLLIIIFIMFIILNQFKTSLLKPIQIHGRYIEMNLFWINLSLLFRQQYHWLRFFNTSMKICVILWTISALILTTFYGGFISSILTIPINTGITSIYRLAEECESHNIIPLIQGNKNTVRRFNVSIFFLITKFN